MIRTLQLISVLLFIVIGPATAQTKYDISSITFELFHSLRIPDNHVTVNIIKSSDKAVLHLVSLPMHKFEKKWAKRDTSFLIDTTTFLKLAETVSLLNELNTVKAEVHGYDGVNCIIQYGSDTQQKRFPVWSPDFDTNNRGLNEYFIACYAILKTAHLPLNIITD